GVTCFDTAPAYGFGRAEEVLGRALGPRRPDAALVSKCGLAWRERGATTAADWWRDGSRSRVAAEIDDSLRRLGTDRLDLYLLHWPDPATPIAETAAALAEVLQTGKARAVGVSNLSLQEIEEFQRVCPVAVVQAGYNLFDRRIETGILPWCRERGIAVMAYGALCYGLLAGGFTAETRFDPADWRAGGRAFGLELFTPENFPRNIAVVEALRPVATRLGKTLPQLALNWVVHRPGVAVALCGVRRPAEIEDNVGATGWRLAAADLAEIDRILVAAAGNTGPPPEW
nr:aldo/keto reductase [Chloroflexia bacterium]